MSPCSIRSNLTLTGSSSCCTPGHHKKWNSCANADRKSVARETYEDNLGFPLKTLCDYMKITHRKARSYVDDLLAKFEDDKNSVMLRLKMLGWTDKEVSDKLLELWPDAKGLSEDSVQKTSRKNGDDNFFGKILDDLTRGHSVDTVAKRHALPPILIWAIKLQSLNDQAKLDELKIKIQPYDVWNFNSCNPLFGAQHPGRIPGELVAHALLIFRQSQTQL